MKHQSINPASFVTEEEARTYARTFGVTPTTIIHSPHASNKTDEKGNRKDYFVGGDDTGFIRNWERVVFEGRGKNA